MRLGVHLPQYGRAASPEAIVSVAVRAEELGFADVWVSDHVAIPASQGYPSPYLFDPVLTLGWAAAATSRVRLGTSVMVVPQHHPLQLANQIASLDRLSGGRVTLGAGVGWSKAEFEALVRRMNEEKTLPQNLFEGLDTDTAWEEMAKVPFQEGNQMGVNFHAFVCRIIF